MLSTEKEYTITIIFKTAKPIHENQLGNLAWAAHTQVLEPADDYDYTTGDDVTPDTYNVRASYTEVF